MFKWKAVKFDFTKNATCVVYVSFDAKKTSGRPHIAEHAQREIFSDFRTAEGEVYKSSISGRNGGFATSSNIENPVVCFKVEKS